MKKCISRIASWFVFFLVLGIGFDAPADELHMFVGAGLRQPVDLLIDEFQKQTGHRVYVDYSGGGQLLARIETASKGDLFMPGAFFYIEKLQKTGQIRSYQRVVCHTPVIGVNTEKAGGRITSFDDLAKPGVRLALGDPKAMAFGRTALSILEKSGQKDAILKNVAVTGATVKQLAMYVAEGSVDAAIIGRSDAFQNREKITMVAIPKLLFESEIIAVAVLQSSTAPGPAQMLANYLSGDHAVTIFQRYGFLPLER